MTLEEEYNARLDALADEIKHLPERNAARGTAYAKRAVAATPEQKAAIEEYRKLMRGSQDGTGDRDMSYGELADLQDMAAQGVIAPDDLEMLEAAGVSEWEATGHGEGNPEDERPCAICGAPEDDALHDRECHFGSDGRHEHHDYQGAA